MINIIEKSVADLERISNLLGKSTPSYRQAYSDRTAWLMACLSELAYVKFNPLFKTNNHNQKKGQLEKELTALEMKLEATFDNDGTQAILVSNNKFIALAFRGTEANSIKDIKADANAKTIRNVKQAGKSIRDSKKLLIRWQKMFKIR